MTRQYLLRSDRPLKNCIMQPINGNSSASGNRRIFKRRWWLFVIVKLCVYVCMWTSLFLDVCCVTRYANQRTYAVLLCFEIHSSFSILLYIVVMTRSVWKVLAAYSWILHVELNSKSNWKSILLRNWSNFLVDSTTCRKYGRGRSTSHCYFACNRKAV